MVFVFSTTLLVRLLHVLIRVQHLLVLTNLFHTDDRTLEHFLKYVNEFKGCIRLIDLVARQIQIHTAERTKLRDRHLHFAVH